MSPSEILKRECEEITQRTGRYIAPYRMAGLMKTAQRVVNAITRPDGCNNYFESVLVLKIVLNMIREITGEEV